MSLAKNTSGMIYVLKSGDRHKIGFTNNINTRLTQFRTCCSHPVDLVFSKRVINASLVEKAIHSEFGQYRVYREWYQFPFDDPHIRVGNFILERFPERLHSDIDERRAVVILKILEIGPMTDYEIITETGLDKPERVQEDIRTLIDLGVLHVFRDEKGHQLIDVCSMPISIAELRPKLYETTDWMNRQKAMGR